jgi:collagenase-like PrtC family protease
MNNKEWLDKVVLGCTEYNNQRLHTNFQEDEILKFVDWLHKQNNVEYTKPTATHQNTPAHKGIK